MNGDKNKAVKFWWNIGYYDVLIGKLAISKVCKGTLEIFPYFIKSKSAVTQICL